MYELISFEHVWKKKKNQLTPFESIYCSAFNFLETINSNLNLIDIHEV